MHVHWVVLAICVTGAFSRSTQRRGVLVPQLEDEESSLLAALLSSNSEDVQAEASKSFTKRSVAVARHLSPSSRRLKRASPSTDDVTDGPTSPWLRKSLPKTNFITAREHRTEKLKPSAAEEDSRNLSVRTNEIPSPSLRPRSETATERHRDVGVGSDPRQHAPTRRIIYYASLPEISSKPSDNPVSQRRYEPLPLRPKYSRDSRDEITRSQPLAVDRYRYNPSSRVNSYTIIDSEQPIATANRNYPARSANYQELPGTKYNKIPAPYRPSDLNRNSATSQQGYYDSYPRNREPSVEVQGGLPPRDEPYRDYNPRQPAPWSVQIGTRLTVKDDGRPYRRDDGRPFRQEDDGQRRFYVNSQQVQDKARYNAPDEDRTRYRLL